MRTFVLASEAVTPSHPDKLCDRISDAMVDACLVEDAEAACIAECALASGIAFLSLRHDRPLGFDPAALTRRLLRQAAPDPEAPEATVMLDVVQAAPGGVGALDPSRMTTAFGYACDDHPTRMPAPLRLAQGMAGALEAAARGPLAGRVSADGQAQAAVRFEARRPVRLEAAALSLFSDEPAEKLEPALRREVLAPAGLEDEARFVLHLRPGAGGPTTHAGLTGRKTAADAYGGAARHSGSALSGKDPSRAERVAAYAARQLAVSVVAAELARECEVRISYLPGQARPVAVEVDGFGTEAAPEEEIAAALTRAADLRLAAVVERMELRALPARHGGRFYRRLSRAGHFGREDLALPWDAPLALG